MLIIHVMCSKNRQHVNLNWSVRDVVNMNSLTCVAIDMTQFLGLQLKTDYIQTVLWPFQTVLLIFVLLLVLMPILPIHLLLFLFLLLLLVLIMPILFIKILPSILLPHSSRSCIAPNFPVVHHAATRHAKCICPPITLPQCIVQIYSLLLQFTPHLTKCTKKNCI